MVVCAAAGVVVVGVVVVVLCIGTITTVAIARGEMGRCILGSREVVDSSGVVGQ